MFIIQLLPSMTFSVEHSVTVRNSNLGTIFMAGNIMATSHTKHVEKDVNEYVEF